MKPSEKSLDVRRIYYSPAAAAAAAFGPKLILGILFCSLTRWLATRRPPWKYKTPPLLTPVQITGITEPYADERRAVLSYSS